MKGELDQVSGNRSSHDFKDELLLALESSGKSLIEIQTIILPWGKERSEDAITVCGMQFNNSEKGVLNRSRKKIRVRELLEATLAAKEQTHALFQDIARRLKKATEDKKASEMRYRYLAGVARREFAITTSKKRKQSSESVKAGILGTIHDFRPKKQRLDYDGEDDEEEFLVIGKLPKKEEILNGIKQEVLLGNQFACTGERGHLRRELKAKNIKQESPSGSETLARSVCSPPKKRDVSAENLPSPDVYSFSKIRDDLRHRRAVRVSLGLGVYSASKSVESSSNEEENPHFGQSEEMLPRETTPLRSERGSTESWHTTCSLLDTPNLQRKTTSIHQLKNETVGQPVWPGFQHHAGSRRTSDLEPTISKAAESFHVLSQTYSSGCATPDDAYGGRFLESDKGNKESSTSISEIDCPISAKSSSSTNDQSEIASDADSVEVSDSSDIKIGLTSLREHGRNMESNHLNEDCDALSPAARDEATNQDDEEEQVRAATMRILFAARFDTTKPKSGASDSSASDSSASDSSSSATVGPSMSSSESDAPRPIAHTGGKRKFKHRDIGPYVRHALKYARATPGSEAEDSHSTVSAEVGDTYSPTDSLCSSGSSSSDSSSSGAVDCSDDAVSGDDIDLNPFIEYY